MMYFSIVLCYDRGECITYLGHASIPRILSRRHEEGGVAEQCVLCEIGATSTCAMGNFDIKPSFSSIYLFHMHVCLCSDRFPHFFAKYINSRRVG